MEQLPESDLEPIEAAVIKSSPGSSLRAAREAQGMSIEDVVAKIKLAPRQIIALEADDFKALPELAFLRGFVRSYAKLLQLELQPLLDGLPGPVLEKVEPAQLEVSFSADKAQRQQNVNWLIAAMIVVLLIGAFIVWQARAVRTAAGTVATAPEMMALSASEVPANAQLPALAESVSAPLAALPVSQPVASLPVSQPLPVAAVPDAVVATPAPGENTVLRLVFDKESWAQVTDQSGKTLVRQVNQPGSELHLSGTAPFTMVIGHAASVHLFYRDKPVDLTPYINSGSDVARMTLK